MQQVAPPAQAGLLAVDPVKNARALLNYSLPIKNSTIREIQVPEGDAVRCSMPSLRLSC